MRTVHLSTRAQKSFFLFAATFALSSAAIAGQQSSTENLALRARAIASSEAEGTKADFLIDGDITNTHWAAKDGTRPPDTWVQLAWPETISVQEVVIRQEAADSLSHLELEIRDAGGGWKKLRSLGDSTHTLPRTVLVQFDEQKTNGLRLARFAGPVSLMEIEVYDRSDPPVVEMASDLLNHLFGIVTDAFGTQPFVNVPVRLEGTEAGKPWEVTTHTDANGIFAADMPVGLEGDVTAEAEISSSVIARQTLPAGVFTPGLSLPDESVAPVALDGTWRFQPDPPADFYEPSFSDADWKDIQVPSHWVMQGFASKTGVGGYRRRFRMPAEFRGRRIKLEFSGVYSGAEVWLNGKRIGSHEGGFSPFELDITNAARISQDNLLAVRVRENTLSSHLDNMSYYANYPLTGIFRSVKIFSVPEVHIRRLHVQTTFDPAYHDAELTADFSVENESAEEIRGGRLIFALRDPQNRPVAISDEHLDINLPPWSRLEKTLHIKVSAPQHWEAEHPYLYTLRGELSGGARIAEVVSRSFGFRQVEIRGTQFLINGVSIKFRGINHFDADPLTGRAVLADLTHRDLEMMKEANLDAIRTSAFPAVEDLYNEADKMGFYVEEEGPFCWVNESSDLRYLPTIVQRIAEMLDRDRSHPSVVYWSIANESNWGPDFEAAHLFARLHDPTRPNSAGQSTTLELATMHNPITLLRMEERKDVKVPIIWDESLCIFQGDIWGDTREMWLDPGDRDYYIEPLIPIWDAVQSSNNVQGGMIWAWVDDIFLVPGRDSEYGRGSVVGPFHALDGIYHLPGRGIVGDAPWGIVDGWRRKKPEFWHVKMLMSPVHIQDPDLQGWKPGEPANITVDNRYEFTNLSELTLEWSVGNQRGTLHPNIPPHANGAISIPIDPKAQSGQTLSLRFLDKNGALVIPYAAQLGAPPEPSGEPSRKHGPVRYVHEPSWLGGPMDRFIGDDFEIAFDGASGRIRRALVNGHSVLYRSPRLHILPIEATQEEFPLFDTWRLTKPMQIRQVGDAYEIVETGTYRDFTGELRFRITPEGGLRVGYDFIYTGTDTRAREVGLQFGVPLWCDRLQWKRRGEWTVYPEDHIGRNEGTAMAHAPGPQKVPPTQPFALDDTPLGTNDFRSTKRNFVFATLTDKGGYGVGVEAVGSQHLRAMVDPDQIEVNVNDWFGGVAAVASGEWSQNYGTGRELRPDDPSQGTAQNKVAGAIQLYLLGPKNAQTWRRPSQAVPNSR
jgi:hypothetical protein